MPGMVMQMPGRHRSLSAPFLMDQIIHTAFQNNSPSVPYVHAEAERALLFRSTNSGGIFHETRHHERSPFSGTGLRDPRRNMKGTISSLFLPRHPDPAEALSTATCKNGRDVHENGPVVARCWYQTRAHASLTGRSAESGH